MLVRRLLLVGFVALTLVLPLTGCNDATGDGGTSDAPTSTNTTSE